MENKIIEINPYNLINYRHEDDWLSNWQHIGNNYEFLNEQEEAEIGKQS